MDESTVSSLLDDKHFIISLIPSLDTIILAFSGSDWVNIDF